MKVAGCVKRNPEARTPADADEHPLAELVGGVGENDGGVKVAALSKHPEEVCGVEIVERSSDKATPNLGNEERSTSQSQARMFLQKAELCGIFDIYFYA